jgi:phosphoserine phosphatase
MIDEAINDIARGRRIGHVENWGFPVFSMQVTPDDRELLPRGWRPDIKATLDRIITAASPSTVVALDLDNTVLRGDIGDAMFLKMVVELRYAGDDDRFWSLFSNQRAAQLLRGFWTRFQKERPNARYLEPHTWTPEFADYVVLFLRQYEEMLRPADGGRTAYPWVVSLMGRLGADTVRRMADELWKTEMGRAAAPITIHSREYGDYEIQGGLRVHSEMKELIDALHAKRAQVWIVTASSEWLGQYVAGLLKIPPGRVLGMRLRTPTGFEIAAPVTYGAGKVEALGSKRLTPALAIGDSLTDREMLEQTVKQDGVAIVIDRGRIPRNVVEPAARQPFDLLRSQTLK